MASVGGHYHHTAPSDIVWMRHLGAILHRLAGCSSITDMLAALHVLISIMGLILIIFLNLLAVFMVLLQLPGTWMMLLCTGLWAWWYWDEQAIGIWTLASLLVLAIIGEVVETFAGVVTSRQAKSSKRSMLLGLVGGIGGAILGTTMIPVPLFGTLIGACIGAGLGAMLGDHWAGRNWKEVKTAGKAAAKGRLWGTVGKVIIAVIMFIIATTAMIF